MSVEAKTQNLFAPEQFRMSRLQVYNWGTFSDIHDIPITQQGFLFVGRSGAGKSTLLDAFSALLVPPRWVDFNAAAREAERTGRDRNLVSYIRGAWAEQKDDASGEIATRYLRLGTTWSALALTYRNALDRHVVLVQILWLRGSANGAGDVRRHFMIFERPFELTELEAFGQSNLDLRKLKQTVADAFHRSEFSAYAERFRRLLGIESEMALRLLHKAQSAKNLGDLNTFLRDFMLDRPATFEVADRLVSEFDELNAAHQAVVTARRQVETLVPARERHRQRESLLHKNAELDELMVGIDSYAGHRRIDLLKDQIERLNIQAEGLQGEISRKQAALNQHKDSLRELERRHREVGGDQVEAWQAEKSALELQREQCLRKQGQAKEACRQLGRALPNSPQAFAELVGEARQELERWESGSSEMREKRDLLVIQKREAETAFTHTAGELKALERQPSNIPAQMLDLRQGIATAIGAAESALPFIGELIEVKPDEAPWQGAIERVLHGFALSLLVDERHYSALSNHINSCHLGQRLVYYRTGKRDARQARPVGTDSLVLKLNVKKHSQSEWLSSELRHRFDFACVESIQSFRRADRALTREGQIKHSKTRHEKDDRRSIGDRRNWVLGFDNREKLALYRKEAQGLAGRIAELDEHIKALTDQEGARAKRAIHCQTLVNLQWQEVDIAPLLTGIDKLERRIRDALEGNTELKNIADRIERQKKVVRDADEALRKATIDYEKVIGLVDEQEDALNRLQDDPSIVPLTPRQQQGLDERFDRLSEPVRLENLDRLIRSVERAIRDQMEALTKEVGKCDRFIEKQFDEFIFEWPAEAEGLDATLAAASDFFTKLTRLESDGLQAHEQRFFELLESQSHQNLAALSTYLSDARKEILERMDLVNDSLAQVPFNQTSHQSSNQTTYLQIDPSDRQLPDVREFKQEIQQALSYAWGRAGPDDSELAESRFLALRRLVERLSSQEPENKRWRQAVLDVRQHMEFIGRETDESGVEVEVYRSGSGKSGGQRQKLATTCLAAALRYQLGGNEHGVPLYAPVVLDEAFDKADNEFTALAMNIFKNFGFQMIVATPLKSVMTLEPFIGGACFIDISDRRISGVLMIEYDSQQQRLKLPAHAPVPQESAVEVS
ncbi:ATP-binding protein [Magnetovirga frankeli]|uniref:ATP-binding protein n=1 Tax=Magnetovirga frankeli TaxID=947516 RepID=UPI0012931912|nr:ATP-binding protein [gamma proteobacterium SS-5]